MSEKVSKLLFRTTWGTIEISIQDGAVIACDLPVVNHRGAQSFRILSVSSKLAHPGDQTVIKKAGSFLQNLFAGKKTGRMPRLKVLSGTEFQRSVWYYMSGMNRGEVVTYGSLAGKIGRPRAVRAVGQACGANHIPLFIPCHRVVGAGRNPGGFSSGLAWKQLLLDIESLPGRKN